MGCKRKRVEDVRFTQGRGNYVDDIKLPGMLHGDFHRSSHAHARIVKIDTSKAKAVPGRPRGAHRRGSQGRQSRLDADPRRRRPDGARRRQGPVPEPGDRLRRRHRPLYRRRRRRPGRGRVRGASGRRRSVQGDGRGRAHPARGHQGQEGRRSRAAQPPEPHLQLAGRRQGTDRRRLRQGRGRDQGPPQLPARAPLPARDLPVRRQLQQDHRRPHDLRHLPGARMSSAPSCR